MNNNSCIYWFSGTGNSLYAAKRLSAELGSLPLTQITDQSPTGHIGGKGAMVGFVFPSYYCNMPRAVRTFVERLDIAPDTYTFAIITMGGPGQGSVAAIKKALAARGLKLHYGRGIPMPANNVLLYNPADPAKGDKMLEKTNQRLAGFAADIAAGRQLVKSLPIILNGNYKNVKTLDVPFGAGDSCTSCGLCQRICPVNNIQIVEGKPRWLGHCELCVACISWCPAKAINYGGKTQARRRYRHPEITAEDLGR
ncbi:MAG: EFR1 family ferrodoxin [Defluviitaleaceae bacterium]|nr:EFR1 family ferrodoxin [Defluviitaleaceae bacterium]